MEGLPDQASFDAKHLIVIDDLVAETEDRVTKLCTKNIHHCNTSVAYLVQKLFLFRKGKDNRNINLNAQYMVLSKNARDATGVSRLAKKMYPSRVKYMPEASKDVTSVPYCYLLNDRKQETPEHVRLRTSIFVADSTQHTYLLMWQNVGYVENIVIDEMSERMKSKPCAYSCW